MLSVMSVLQGQRVSDPVELLRQCEEALRDSPPRFHRKFTHVGDGGSAPSSPIRVMQWNILAQGRLHLVPKKILASNTNFKFKNNFQIKVDF